MAQNNQVSIHSYFRASWDHESIWEKSWREPNPLTALLPTANRDASFPGFSNSLAPSKNIPTYLFWGARWACGAFSECTALTRVYQVCVGIFQPWLHIGLLTLQMCGLNAKGTESKRTAAGLKPLLLPRTIEITDMYLIRHVQPLSPLTLTRKGLHRKLSVSAWHTHRWPYSIHNPGQAQTAASRWLLVIPELSPRAPTQVPPSNSMFLGLWEVNLQLKFHK